VTQSAQRSWTVATLGIAVGLWTAVGTAEARRMPGPCAAAADGEDAPYVAVLSAFPAEIAPLVAATDVQERITIDGRDYYGGRLGGVRVLLGLVGIGMVNAEQRARAVVDHVQVAAVIVSGVAGGALIGDATIAQRWQEQDRRRVYRVNRALVALARRAEAARTEPLQACTPVPPTDPGAAIVCLLHQPVVVFGGSGVSGDDFGGAALPCVPGGSEVFGCELPPLPSLTATVARASVPSTTEPDVVDMETAAIARVAARRRVPFLAVRAASDGGGDPLGDRAFPAQFFDYYRLAAANAASVTQAVVEELGTLAGETAQRGTCRLMAKRRWRRAARRLERELAAAAAPS
jgi:adenosylhomocysteine nucleosidase